LYNLREANRQDLVEIERMNIASENGTKELQDLTILLKNCEFEYNKNVIKAADIEKGIQQKTQEI